MHFKHVDMSIDIASYHIKGMRFLAPVGYVLPENMNTNLRNQHNGVNKLYRNSFSLYDVFTVMAKLQD